jgi:uncharacterized protein
MLNRQLLRYKIKGDQLEPQLLSATPAISELAELLLRHFHAQIGQTVAEAEDSAMPILHRTRSLIIARGLQKILLDATEVTEPAAQELLRAQAFAACAQELSAPLPNSDEHAARIAAALGSTAPELRAQLYSDLSDQARLTQVPPWTTTQFIAHYNHALLQGLLLHAQTMTITVWDNDIGLRRQLMKAMRFRRLLADIQRTSDGTMRVVISGPLSVLEQNNRYGMQFALLLPAVACAKKWTINADIKMPHDQSNKPSLNLVLDQHMGIIGESRFLRFIPPEMQAAEQALKERCPAWVWDEPPLITQRSGEIIVSDWCVVIGEKRFTIELCHRWHDHAVERRLQQIADGFLPRHILGIDRAIIKRLPQVAEHPAFLQQGFLFSDMPTARALAQVLEKNAAQASP